MKKILLSLLFLLPFVAIAQLSVVAESQPFDEPEDGFARILALKNGSTAFLHITYKEGIDVKIFDPSHKEIVSKTIDPDYGKLKSPHVQGIYEIDNSINLFISEIDEGIPSLYRILIDEKDGHLIEKKTIGTLKKISMAQGYAVAFGGVPLPSFIVRKDPYSDNYGEVLYNTFESARDKRVELVLYNASGQELSRNYLSSPENKYKFTQIIDYVLIGNTAYALIYSYNTESSGGASNELLLATFSDGKVTYDNLGKSIKNRINDGIIRYNPITKNLIFLTSEYTNSKGQNVYYNIEFAIINPLNPEIKQTLSFNKSMIINKYKEVFRGSEKYAPLPQNLYINDDGSFTVLMQAVSQIVTTTSHGSHNSGSILGTAAVLTFSEDGEEKSAELIPMEQTNFAKMMSNDYRNIDAYYIADRENSAAILSQGNQYKSLVYLNGKKKNYIFLNDIEDNEERIKKGRLTNIKGVGDCDAYVYDLSDTKSNIPPRSLLFKKERSRDNNLAIFNISDYDRERDIYATLKLENKRQVKVVWCKGG